MMHKQILLLLFVVILCVTITRIESSSEAYDDDLKEPTMEELLSNIEEIFKDTNQIQENLINDNDSDYDDIEASEYKSFFKNNLPDSLEEDDDSTNQFGNRRKRFLGSLIKYIDQKRKTTIHAPTDTTAMSTKYPLLVTDNSEPKHKSPMSNSDSYTEDSFYKLKIHCLKTYDSLCLEKKKTNERIN